MNKKTDKKIKPATKQELKTKPKSGSKAFNVARPADTPIVPQSDNKGKELMSTAETSKDISIFDPNSGRLKAIEAFGKGVAGNTIPNTKLTFTVPITEDDLNILRKLSKLEDRSQRKIAERLFSKVLQEEIGKYKL